MHLSFPSLSPSYPLCVRTPSAILPAPRKAIASAKPAARSRVGNGRAILPDVDGRSSEMRRYRDILAQLVADMGGDPSEAQTIIARRAATLAVWCEGCEAAMANGGELDIAAFTTASNALRRLLADLGLERRVKDVTPTITEYMARKRPRQPEAA